MHLEESCSESNASYFIMLAHNIRGRYWCYGSVGWTFPPALHYMLFLCDRWQQRGCMTDWCLTWKCIWREGASLNSSTWKKTALIDIHWCLLNVEMETKQWMSAHFGGGWCISAVVTATVVMSTGTYFCKCSMLVLVDHWQNALLMMVTMLKSSVLWLRICSIKLHYCVLCICCIFYGNT